MKSFISWLNNFIHSNKEKELPKENSIIFSLPKNESKPLIKIRLTNMSEEDCKNYASMIFNINFGLYEKTTFDLLNKTGTEDIETEAFIKNIPMYYMFKVKEIETKLKTDDVSQLKPIVSPTEFRKYAQ